MKITKSKSSTPCLDTNIWITKTPHGLELSETKSKGADKRYSVTHVELSNLEFLRLFKVILRGRVNNRALNVLAWLLQKVIK